MYKTERFVSEEDLVRFLNRNNIDKTNIISILYQLDIDNDYAEFVLVYLVG